MLVVFAPPELVGAHRSAKFSAFEALEAASSRRPVVAGPRRPNGSYRVDEKAPFLHPSRHIIARTLDRSSSVMEATTHPPEFT